MKKIIVISLLIILSVYINAFAQTESQPEPALPICEFDGYIISIPIRPPDKTSDLNKTLTVHIDSVRLVSSGDPDNHPRSDCNEILDKDVKVWIADQGRNNSYSIDKIKVGNKISGKRVLGGVEAFGLVFSEGIANNTFDNKSDLIEGGIYTVAEILRNTATTSRRFAVEAYVINKGIIPKCDPSADTCHINPEPWIDIVDDNISKIKSWTIYAKPSQGLIKSINSLELQKKYRFWLNVRNMTNKVGQKNNNNLSLISVENINIDLVSTSTPEIRVKPDSLNFFARISNWFMKLFK